ncbi:hypothetical protein GE09DRAFT_1090351 [Coniochaeta sp. 2T2.1]|nr:hypothetical protein GE09DRAFT_1090351 [Coniochaeta sp. 2T2.1]
MSTTNVWLCLLVLLGVHIVVADGVMQQRDGSKENDVCTQFGCETDILLPRLRPHSARQGQHGIDLHTPDHVRLLDICSGTRHERNHRRRTGRY